MTTRTTRIYMPLLDEGTSVIRQTQGKQIKENTFQVLPTEDYDPWLETGAFPPGTVVECEREVWENEEVWVARNIYKPGCG